MLALILIAVTLSPVNGQAASRRKCIRKICKTEKEFCVTAFEDEFGAFTKGCDGFERELRRECKKFRKDTFRKNKEKCKIAFMDCKRCCKRDQLACGISLGNDCPPNVAGGPNLALFTVAAGGDLDVGWTGIGHNQGLVIGTQFVGCLRDCDTATNPICTGTARVRKRSINGMEFASPLPMLVADVAICVTNELREPATIRALNLQTGAIDMQVNLKSVVYLTGDKKNPCPICTGEAIGAVGECKGFTNAKGRSCTTEGITDRFGNTSSDCLPFAADNAGELEVELDFISSGTVTRQATIPCAKGLCLCSEGRNPPFMNECDDPLSCSEQVCIDNGGSDDVRKGIQPGIDQECCMKGRYNIPCYDAEISRTGKAVPLEPAWPHPMYPKTGAGKVAAVFCIPPTNSGTINQPTGLEGPGAFVVPVETYVDLFP